MKLNTNAVPRTNRNILRRGGTIPDPWRTILNRRYMGLGGRGYTYSLTTLLCRSYESVASGRAGTVVFT